MGIVLGPLHLRQASLKLSFLEVHGNVGWLLLPQGAAGGFEETQRKQPLLPRHPDRSTGRAGLRLLPCIWLRHRRQGEPTSLAYGAQPPGRTLCAGLAPPLECTTTDGVATGQAPG